jgi:hypothetical protein
LILSSGQKLSDFKIVLSIFRGELDVKEREQLSERAIGGIWSSESSLVHGCFYLKTEDYAAVWDQVCDGMYAACQITLGLSPVRPSDKLLKFVWSDDKPLSIETAAIVFARESPKKPAKRETFTRNKQWAVVLFVMALIAWLFPQWNGTFFQASKDITAGEGTIVAAILFVGGLLLWFLDSSRHSVDD